jgi:hypothetical protein
LSVAESRLTVKVGGESLVLRPSYITLFPPRTTTA